VGGVSKKAPVKKKAGGNKQPKQNMKNVVQKITKQIQNKISSMNTSKGFNASIQSKISGAPIANSVQDANKFRDYLAMLKNPGVVKSVPMPLLNFGKTHIRTIRYRVSKAVDATSGNLAATFNFASMCMPSDSWDWSGSLLTADPAYNPNSTTNTGFAVSNNWDLGLYGANGINNMNDHFDIVSCIAGKVEISITGVSNLNRKGKIYLAEDTTNLWYAGNSTDGTQAQNQVNLYPISTLTKLTHKKSIDLISLKNDSRLVYKYIPATNYSNMKQAEPKTPATGTHTESNLQKLGVLVVEAAATGTTLVFDYTIVLQTRPHITQLNTYPPEYSSCFINPDPYLRLMESDTRNVINVN